MTTRTVHCGDGVAFLAAPLPAGHAIVTSLPDHSEVPALGVDGWRAWFSDTVAAACRAVADDAVAMDSLTINTAKGARATVSISGHKHIGGTGTNHNDNERVVALCRTVCTQIAIDGAER